MPEILYVIGAASLLVAGAFAVLIRRQGECDMVLEVRKARDFRLDPTGERTAVFSCHVPLTNKGKQDGMVVDLFCEARHPTGRGARPKIIPFARIDGAHDGARDVAHDAAHDGMRGGTGGDRPWEALSLRRGESAMLEMGATLTALRREPGESWADLLARLGSLVLRVRCKVVGRKSITWRLSEVAFPLDELARKVA